MNEIQKARIIRIVKICVLVLIGIIMFTKCMFLFTSQIEAKGRSFSSDLDDHIEMSIKGNGYSILFRTIEWLYKVTDTVNSVAVLESFMMIITWLATALLIRAIYGKLDFFASAIIALPTMFVTGIFFPGVHPFYYRRQLVAQPYHNITYTGMRMFAVLAMLVFHRLIDKYLEKIEWYYWLLLTLSLALSTAIKPSFFYGFALTLFFFLLFAFFQNRCRLKPFLMMVILGSVVFLSMYVMFGQATILYADKPSGQSSGIEFVWGERFIKYGYFDTIWKILCSLAFPLLVGIANIKKLKKTEIFVYAMYGIQLALTILLAESGKRANDGNFYWGLYCGGFFLFLVAFGRYWTNVKESTEHGKYYKYYINSGMILMALHIVSSVGYCATVMLGKSYLV